MSDKQLLCVLRALADSLLGQNEEIRLLREEVAFLRNRMTTYLGDGIALTYLFDETPILVKSNDFGLASNLIAGGLHEENNLTVLLSFVRDDTVFLDIGANLGYFSLQIGQRVKNTGKVHAFEPLPVLQDLFRRSVFLNGLRDAVELHPFGLSDVNDNVRIGVRRGDMSSGSFEAENGPQIEFLNAQVRRLDDVFGEDFSCDLVKIDIEGHEFHALNGMRRIIERSPHIKILFESFPMGDPANKGRIEELFVELGFELYVVCPNATLQKLNPGELTRSDQEWYILARRPQDADEVTQRNSFSIFPRQLYFSPAIAPETIGRRVNIRGSHGQILFYGPYWFLRKGTWRIRVHGDIAGVLLLRVATRFGHRIDEARFAPGEHEKVVVLKQDALQFECIGVALTNQTNVSIERIEFVRDS